jgi:putative ABC transport system permease protein
MHLRAAEGMKRAGSFVAIVLGAVIVAAITLLPGWALLAGAVLIFLWMFLTRSGRQAWSLTEVGIATLPQRLSSSSVIVLGIAGVVGVLVALLAMAAGFQDTLRATGTTDTVIVMRAGSGTELNSVVDHDTAQIVSEAPQIKRDASGAPVASPEIVVVASLPERTSGLDANVEIRGLSVHAWELHPGVRIMAGRRFGTGMHELIAGRRAQQQFRNVSIGSTLWLNGQAWRIVGLFESGDAHESELWGDTDSIGATYRRGSSTSSVNLQLTAPGALKAYQDFIANDPRLQVDVQTTQAYYSAQSASLTDTIRVLGTAVGAIMAVGALFGALNSMYAAVAGRTREIATLRAIGFPSLPVIVSVMVEAMTLAAAGGLFGGLLARLIFDGYTTSTLGANFSQVVFTFSVSPPLFATGLRWALAIGLAGGLFPALHAARLSVTAGLRQV